MLKGTTINSVASVNMMMAFSGRKHQPAEPMLKGLRSIHATLTKMLDQSTSNHYYLSSLDPGVGKSTAIITWLAAYLENPGAYGNEGVLICLERLEEIQRYVDDGEMPEDSYAVIVSDDGELGKELNCRGVGKDRASEAIILFTTKAQIKKRCNGNKFKSVATLHYQGKPRSVKVWDESFSIGTEIALNPLDFGKLFSGLDDKDKALRKMVNKIIDDIEELKGDDVYTFPMLPVTRAELLHTFQWKTDAERDLADLLGQLSWQPVTIREYKGRKYIIDCVQAIPEDFSPCLILDASGRVKESYNLQQKYLNNVVNLTTPDQFKSYRNLAVNVWRRSSSKIALINDQVEVALEISRVIADRPGEEFLILHYKSQGYLLKAVLKQLPQEDHERVKSVTYGKHTATNSFSDIPNVIIISPYFYRDYNYEALARAATMSRTAMGNMPQDEISRIRKGEIAHNLLQGGLRGRARRSEGDTCPESRIWLIAAPNTGVEAELLTIFPDCKVHTWKTENSTLTPHQQRALNYLKELLPVGIDEIAATTVMDKLGIKKACNFKRSLLDHRPFHEALTAVGISVVKRGKPWYFSRF